MLKGVEIPVVQTDKELSPIVLPSLSALPSLYPHSSPPIGWITCSALVLRRQQAGQDETALSLKNTYPYHPREVFGRLSSNCANGSTIGEINCKQVVGYFNQNQILMDVCNLASMKPFRPHMTDSDRQTQETKPM